MASGWACSPESPFLEANHANEILSPYIQSMDIHSKQMTFCAFRLDALLPLIKQIWKVSASFPKLAKLVTKDQSEVRIHTRGHDPTLRNVSSLI